jgi:hypothetical protein
MLKTCVENFQYLKKSTSYPMHFPIVVQGSQVPKGYDALHDLVIVALYVNKTIRVGYWDPQKSLGSC